MLSLSTDLFAHVQGKLCTVFQFGLVLGPCQSSVNFFLTASFAHILRRCDGAFYRWEKKQRDISLLTVTGTNVGQYVLQTKWHHTPSFWCLPKMTHMNLFCSAALVKGIAHHFLFTLVAIVYNMILLFYVNLFYLSIYLSIYLSYYRYRLSIPSRTLFLERDVAFKFSNVICRCCEHQN